MYELISFYPTTDLEACRDFYGQLLGLALARDQQTCLIFKVHQTSYLGFCQHQETLPYHKGLIITLVTADVDGIYQRFKTQGIMMEEVPKLNEYYGIYHFFARDPNGYRLEIQRFLEPL